MVGRLMVNKLCLNMLNNSLMRLILMGKVRGSVRFLKGGTKYTVLREVNRLYVMLREVNRLNNMLREVKRLDAMLRVVNSLYAMLRVVNRLYAMLDVDGLLPVAIRF